MLGTEFSLYFLSKENMITPETILYRIGSGLTVYVTKKYGESIRGFTDNEQKE